MSRLWRISYLICADHVKINKEVVHCSHRRYDGFLAERLIGRDFRWRRRGSWGSANLSFWRFPGRKQEQDVARKEYYPYRYSKRVFSNVCHLALDDEDRAFSCSSPFVSGICLRNQGSRDKTLILALYAYLYCYLNSLNITIVAPVLGHYSATCCSKPDSLKATVKPRDVGYLPEKCLCSILFPFPENFCTIWLPAIMGLSSSRVGPFCSWQKLTNGTQYSSRTIILPGWAAPREWLVSLVNFNLATTEPRFRVIPDSKQNELSISVGRPLFNWSKRTFLCYLSTQASSFWVLVQNYRAVMFSNAFLLVSSIFFFVYWQQFLLIPKLIATNLPIWKDFTHTVCGIQPTRFVVVLAFLPMASAVLWSFTLWSWSLGSIFEKRFRLGY